MLWIKAEHVKYCSALSQDLLSLLSTCPEMHGLLMVDIYCEAML